MQDIYESWCVQLEATHYLNNTLANTKLRHIISHLKGLNSWFKPSMNSSVYKTYLEMHLYTCSLTERTNAFVTIEQPSTL